MDLIETRSRLKTCLWRRTSLQISLDNADKKQYLNYFLEYIQCGGFLEDEHTQGIYELLKGCRKLTDDMVIDDILSEGKITVAGALERNRSLTIEDVRKRIAACFAQHMNSDSRYEHMRNFLYCGGAAEDFEPPIRETVLSIAKELDMLSGFESNANEREGLTIDYPQSSIDTSSEESLLRTIRSGDFLIISYFCPDTRKRYVRTFSVVRYDGGMSSLHCITGERDFTINCDGAFCLNNIAEWEIRIRGVIRRERIAAAVEACDVPVQKKRKRN